MIFGLDADQLSKLVQDSIELKIFHVEQLLNRYSGKRYHLRESISSGHISLVEVKKLGKEKIIIENLTPEQMWGWFGKHLKVVVDLK